MLQDEGEFVPDYEEEPDGRGVPAYLTMDPVLATTSDGGAREPALPDKGRKCLPRLIAGKLQRHLQDAHLPWYLVPNLERWSCRCCESSLAFLQQRARGFEPLVNRDRGRAGVSGRKDFESWDKVIYEKSIYS